LNQCTQPAVSRPTAARPVQDGCRSISSVLNRPIVDSISALSRAPTEPIAPAIPASDRRQRQAVATIFRGSLTRMPELYGPLQAQLASVDVPVLVGWGDRDPFFSIDQGERTAAALHTQLRVYLGAGHFLPEERPRQLTDDIAALAKAGTCG
jgi:pimeloyl-ACP methyl ester carboxylesterase